MIKGVLVAESLRTGCSLADVRLVVLSITRTDPANVTSVQPSTWTLIKFEADDAEAPMLSDQLANVLDGPGWYADFHTDTESFVVFPHRVFRYLRGDEYERRLAEDYARSLGIPESQLDWPT